MVFSTRLPPCLAHAFSITAGVGQNGNTVRDARRARMFHILLYTFLHNIVATLEFYLWCDAFLTASTFLQNINPLDVSLMFYLELDQLVDLY